MRLAATVRAALGAVLLGWGLFAPALAHAGGFAVPEIGARRTGMVAVVGRPDDLSAIYHNPAGLSLLDGTQLYLSFGVALAGTDFRIRPWEGADRYIDAPVDANGFYPPAKPTRTYGLIPMLAASTTLWRDLTVGLALYVPNAVGAAFDPKGVTRYHLYDSYAVAGYGGLSLAWAPAPWLAVGAGVSLIYVRLHGQRKVFPVLNGTDYGDFLGGSSDLSLDGSDVAAGWNAGVILWVHPRLSLGATVISRSALTVEGPVKVRLGEDAVIQTELTGTQRTGLLVPWTFMCGANLDAARFLEIGFELRYWFSREIQNQHTDITGIELITALDSPRNYRDSYQVAGGVRVHSLAPVPDLDIMLGTHYDRTPAPDSTVSLDSPSFTHVGLHTGLRYTLKKRYRLSLTYAHYWYLSRDVTDSVTQPPSNFRGGGSNNIITFSVEALIGRGLVRRTPRPRGPQ